jgi:formylglycine-generating enzyme required for sulfatase activity
MNIEIAPKETEIQASWDDAKLYCFALNTNNKTGWRLPTEEELIAICRSTNDFVPAYYWSSDVWANFRVAGLNFGNGCQYEYRKNNVGYVRAVRDL